MATLAFDGLSWPERLLHPLNDGEAARAFVECPRNLPFAVHIRGRLDVDRLDQALRWVVGRHEVLRARYLQTDAQLVRVTADRLPVGSYVDNAYGDCSIDDARLQRRLLDDVSEPFELSTGPLVRVRLCPLNAEHAVLVMVTHHIVFDGWSRRVLLGEVKSLYEAAVTGQTATLPGLAARYADYAVRHHRPSTEAALALDALARDLAGVKPLELRRRPAGPGSNRSGILRFRIEPPIAARVRAAARTHGVTVATVALTLFALLLRDRSGQTETVLGVPTVDRPLARFESVVGLFLNLLVLRLDLSSVPSFEAAIARVSATLMEAYDHRAVHYGALLERLADHQGPRGPIRVVFNFVNVPGLALQLPGVTTCVLPLDGDQPSAADLSLHLGDDRTAIEGFFLYKADLFAPADIQDLVDGLVALADLHAPAHL